MTIVDHGEPFNILHRSKIIHIIAFQNKALNRKRWKKCEHFDSVRFWVKTVSKFRENLSKNQELRSVC